jgi:hypothetical protein
MSPAPPPGPDGQDEILSTLARIERFLFRILQGIVIFFAQKIPRFLYDVLKALWRNFWAYFEKLARIIGRAGRVAILSMLLVLVVVGPGVVLYRSESHPVLLVLWIALIAGALLYAFQHYLWKEYLRRKQERAARVGSRLVCVSCRTAHKGLKPPVVCRICGKPWVGVEV